MSCLGCLVGGICFGWRIFNYGGSWRSLILCQFSCLRLCMSMECAYCAAIILICLNVFLIFVIGSVNVDSKFFIDGIYVVPLAPASSTMSRATFQPIVMMLFMSGWCIVIFLLKV